MVEQIVTADRQHQVNVSQPARIVQQLRSLDSNVDDNLTKDSRQNASIWARSANWAAVELSMLRNRAPVGGDATITRSLDAFVPSAIGPLRNHQTDLPRIARDPRLTAAIDAALRDIQIGRASCRERV